MSGADRARKRRQEKHEAGLKEVRGLWYPPECHDGIKALTKRYYGYYKIRKGVMDQIDKFLEKVL